MKVTSSQKGVFLAKLEFMDLLLSPAKYFWY